MKISKLSIENFKSFGKVEIAFQPINLFIGANASGKSNLIAVFEFLKNVQLVGIEETVSRMGGIQALLNANTEKTDFTICVTFEGKEILSEETLSPEITLLKVREKLIYVIEVIKNERHFHLQEKITFEERYVERYLTEEEQFLTSEIIYGFTNHSGKLEGFYQPFTQVAHHNEVTPHLPANPPFTAEMLAALSSANENRSLLELRGILAPSKLFQVGIYDIQPKLAKLNNLYANIEVLNKDGSNLTQVVNQILQKDTETAQQFIASVGGVLDFVDNIKVDRFENLLFMRIKERYNKNWIDSSLISDGTVNVIAMIVALYYQPYQISFFEEPERAIHPSLIELLIERLQTQVEYTEKQLFVTTHSPEMLKAFYEKVGMKSILFVNKSKKTNNCTEIQCLLEKENAKDFIEILGIEESFVQELIK